MKQKQSHAQKKLFTHRGKCMFHSKTQCTAKNGQPAHSEMHMSLNTEMVSVAAVFVKGRQGMKEDDEEARTRAGKD